MPRRFLVFSIATNGFDVAYRCCIETQRRYARANGYDHVLVRTPYFVWHFSAHDSAWLKIPLILGALSRNYEWILFVDADCEIRPTCPPIQSVERLGKAIYVANGFSGRPNAGVIIVKQSREAIEFFRRLLQAADDSDIPAEDRAPYENGHFIHYAKNCDAIQIIDSAWNNNRDACLPDFVRHYTGPLKGAYRAGMIQRAAPRVAKLVIGAGRTTVGARSALRRLVMRDACPPLPVRERLRGLFEASCRRYPRYFSSTAWVDGP